ncbi:unnamed protein product [Parascedosporium putredinis]|uniref:Apple domain-containing protein n=1 Tax=Parascedosporium putredinis TaxID=1442378 RepID=A0A9P1M915_9PEZI|nr:unnamed protein product [Parascedosporium putredinis]CAI7991023.1 unnamed protein product [Parascedosporium putredinis]
MLSLVPLALGLSTLFHPVSARRSQCSARSRSTVLSYPTDGPDDPTGTGQPPETTTAPPVKRAVVNTCSNGNFAGYDPNWRNGIYGFNSTGDVMLLQQYGYQGDGSEEAGCVQMAAGPGRKRQVSDTWDASLEQFFPYLEPDTSYTIRIWYTILSSSVEGACRINGYYGDTLFDSTDPFPLVTDAVVGQSPWYEFLTTAGVTTSEGGFTQPPVTVTTDNDPVSTSTEEESSQDSGTTAEPTAEPTSTDDGGAVTTTTSDGESSPTTTPDSVCVAATGPPALGKGCGLRRALTTNYYQRVGPDEITQAACAAACHNDANCQSFAWGPWYTDSTGVTAKGCANACFLWSTGFEAASASTSTTDLLGFDRSCIAEVDCATQPSGEACLNLSYSRPCSQAMGKPKSCALPMHTVMLASLCGSNGCRDLCAQYPSCKSFSGGFGSWYECKLYSEPMSQVMEAGGSVLFTDMDCFECTPDAPSVKYLPQLADPTNMPAFDCTVPASTSTSTSPPSSTATETETETETPATATETDSPTATPTSTGCQTGQTCSAVLLAPASASCGNRGDVVYDAWSCSAFAHDSAQNSCVFIGAKLSAAGFTASSTSNRVWYDRECFECTTCQDTPSSASSAPTQSTTTTPTSDCPLDWGQGCTLATTTPADTLCRVVGSPMEEAYAVPLDIFPYQDNFWQCAALCTQQFGCRAFAHDPATQVCAMISRRLSAAEFTTGASYDLTWYDMDCFKCTDCQEVPPMPTPSAETTPSTSDISSTSSASSTSSPPAETTSCTVPTPFLSETTLCGMPGSAGNQVQSAALQNYVIKPVENLAACALVCLEREDCLSFSYIAESRVCYPYRAGLANLGLSYFGLHGRHYARVAIMIYRNHDAVFPKPALINWHGSGFVFPSLSIDHEYCSQIAQKAGIFVLDADYRKSPEHPYPAPVEDVEDVLAWVGEQSTFIDASRLAVSGFSAGAVLAFVAASVLRSSYPKLNIRAALGVYPGTDLATDPQTRIIPAPVQPIPPKVLDIFLTRTRR